MDVQNFRNSKRYVKSMKLNENKDFDLKNRLYALKKFLIFFYFTDGSHYLDFKIHC